MVLNLFSRSASKNRVRNERGAAMIEYALLAALLALSLLTAVTFIRGSAEEKFGTFRAATSGDIDHSIGGPP